jgi:tetratricopeptide (TPR) repeat protein
MIKPFRSIVATCAVFSLSVNIVGPSTCLSAPAQQVIINGDDNNVVDGNLTINNGVGKSELKSVRKEIQELKQIALQQNLQAAQSKPAFQKIVQNIYHKSYAALTEREHITFWENVQAALERAEKAERDFENVRQGTVNAQLKALFPKIEAARNDFNYDEVNQLLSEFRNNHKDLRQDLARVDFLQGQNYELQINYAEAERYYKRAAVNDDENTLYLDAHARILKTLGRYAEAEPLYRRALAIDEKALGLKHPDVATSLNNLAGLLYKQGKYVEAEPLYRRALAIGEKTLGPDHPAVATRLNNLAGLLEAQGKYVEAEPLYRRALAIGEKTLGTDHPDVATWLNNLAGLLRAQGKYVEAEPLYRRALAIGEKTLGTDHPAVATRLNNLAGLLEAQGKYVEAEPLCRRALAIYEIALGSGHPNTIQIRNNLNVLLEKSKH